ncbi:MAG: pyrimidine-nucleoside phosphorylase [Traorella sp.]
MRFVDIIEKKREGKSLNREEIHFWIKNYVEDLIPDYQVSALCMAIYFQGMNDDEITWLCDEMLHSGDVIDLSMIDGIKADKHSTGGVGDKTSLSLAPMVASCGLKIAKMSGRGLGHTGGTLDKLESIEGMNVNLNSSQFIHQVNKIGISIIGQTQSLVPADKKLYSLRDVTGTVNSIPLIATSIMSKKLASGSDTILLDVKFGEGAFMKTPQEAEELAKTMIKIGKKLNKDTKAMISNMNQPLGNAIGNALEVKEAIATLKDEGPSDFKELCMQAGSIMLMQGNIANNEQEARKMLQENIKNGKAFEKLVQMVKEQGGNIEQIYHPELLPQAKMKIEIAALEEGYIKEVNALRLGNLAMLIGAGRKVKEDRINHAVGIVLNKKDGDFVSKGDILAVVHTDTTLSKEWIHDLYNCFKMDSQPVEKQPLIYKIIE